MPFRRLILTTILLAFPLAGLFFLARENRTGRWESEVSKRKEDLQKILAHFQRMGEPVSHFQSLIRRLTRALKWGEDPTAILGGFPAGSTRVFAFSDNGRRLFLPGEKKDLVFTSQLALDVLRKVASKNGYRISRKDGRLLESFWGNEKATNLLALNPGKLVQIVPGPEGRLGGVFPFKTRSGRKRFLLVLMDSRKIDLDLFHRKALKRIQELAGPLFEFGVIDLGRKFPDRGLGANFPLAPEVRKILVSPRLNPGFLARGRFFHSLLESSRFLLYGSVRLPESPFTDEELPRIVGTNGFPARLFPGTSSLPGWMFTPIPWIVLAGALLTLLTWIQREGDKRMIPLRSQVIILISLATLGSMAVMLGFARSYQEKRERSLIRERVKQSEEILGKLDGDFLGLIFSKSKYFRQIISGVRENWNDPKSRLAGLESFRKLPREISVVLQDSSGQTLFRHFASPSDMKRVFGEDFEALFKQVGEEVITRKKSLGRRNPAQGLGDFQLNRILVGFLANQSIQFQGELKLYEVDKRTFWAFFDLLEDPAGKSLGTFIALHENLSLEREFFLNRQQELLCHSFRDPFSFRISVLPKDGSKRGEIVPEPSREEDLRDLNDLVTQTGASCSKTGRHRGQNVIMTGIPGKNFPDHNLFLATPLKPIQNEIQELGRDFRLFAILSLFFAWSLGLLCSGILLKPLEGLSQGIKLLNESRFQATFEVGSSDILGEVATGIRGIMQEWQELAVARSIQEELFPPRPISREGWTLQGWNRSASDIGGEFFDFFEISGDRVCFVMVGIPGGKIVSAFFLGMLKTAIRLLSEQGERPRGTYQQLSRLFPTLLPALEKGIFVVGFFHPATGRVSLFSRGPAVGFGIRKTRPMAEGHIETGGWSLVNSFKGHVEKEEDLSRSDGLLILSDGLFQVPQNLEERFSRPDFDELLRDSHTSPTEGLGPQVFSLLDQRYSQTGPWTSQTILLIDPGGVSGGEVRE